MAMVMAMVMEMSMATMENIRAKVDWFPIRVTYSRELKFQKLLQDRGFETFIPMCVKILDKDGKKKESITVPAISNLCFVKASRAELDDLIRGAETGSIARYMWNPVTRNPLIVPEKQMDDFIRVSSTMSDDLVYMSQVDARLKAGQKVRVRTGPFAGVEGVIVRVKRSRRVMVELPGMLAVATGYIPEQDLEKL